MAESYADATHADIRLRTARNLPVAMLQRRRHHRGILRQEHDLLSIHAQAESGSVHGDALALRGIEGHFHHQEILHHEHLLAAAEAVHHILGADLVQPRRGMHGIFFGGSFGIAALGVGRNGSGKEDQRAQHAPIVPSQRAILFRQEKAKR